MLNADDTKKQDISISLKHSLLLSAKPNIGLIKQTQRAMHDFYHHRVTIESWKLS